MSERRRGRGGHARDGAAHAIAQMPWRIPLNPDRPTEPLPPEYPDPKAFFTVTFYYNEQPPN